MKKTNYKIIEVSNTYRVEEDGKIVVHGFPEKDMALHGIWVHEGSEPLDWYVYDDDGVVYKGALEERVND